MADVGSLTSTFTEFDPEPAGTPDPLGWDGYPESVAAARERTGSPESARCGHGKIGDHEAVLVAFDFRFLGGSIGTATGTRIAGAFDRARSLGLPVVSLLATGGSRMQEGMLSLRQLQRIAGRCVRHREAGLAHISVLRNPTTGGVWASLGSIADVVIGIAGAQVGFAGSRVRPAHQVADPAYTAESQHAAGQVDELTTEQDLPGVLAGWLELLTNGAESVPVPSALGELSPAPDGWAAVLRARSASRPRAGAYLDDYFDTRRAISGDRCGGVDSGMLCGIGRRDERSIAYAAQAGTPTTPAGYRTASRLIRLADRLRLPVLTLVDTPGAAAGPAAERGGLGPAIAELFATIAAARVPVTTLVIGEGGSGGALALSSPDNTWITPDAYFSVIAPELAAAILKRGPADVPMTAAQLKLRPEDLVELGVVRGVAG